MPLEPAANLIVMPGRAPATAVEMASLVQMAGLDAQVAAYDFWAEDSENPDLQAEIAALVRRAPAYVIAKSIGSLITMLAQRDHGLHVRGAVFLGVPMRRLQHEGRLDLLHDHCRQTPTFVMQRRDDPTGSFAEVAQALAGSTGAVLRELPGETHDYADAEVAAALRDWWRRCSSVE